MTNTTPDDQLSSAPFANLKGDDDGEGAPKKDAALASLEGQLQGERDARMEERFVWIVVTVILIDVLWFRNAQNATIPIVVLALEFVILIVLARRMGIEELAHLFERLINAIGKNGG